MTTPQTTSLPEALFALGYTDLISVIPPDGKLVPKSSIPANAVGKVPGIRTTNGMWTGYNWRKTVHTAEDVKGWLMHAEPANVGLRADRFPGVDIDVTDAALAQVVQDAAVAYLGSAPVRTGRAPKRLMMYKTHEPFSRMRLWIKRGEEHHLIEVLGQGQQYVVHGTHPATRQPYSWDEDLTLLPAQEYLTLITREDAEAFLTKVIEVLTPMGGFTFEREGDGRARTERGGDQDSLKAPSIDALREAVAVIPNTNSLFPGRDDYLRMGYAIRAAGAEDTDEAFHIFAGWADRWEGNDRADRNDPDVVLADWRRIRGPFAVGWTWITEQAAAFGYDVASHDFDAAGERPDDSVIEAPLYSDQWLADRTISALRHTLRFVPQRGHFLAYEGGRWRPDAELLAEDGIKRELRRLADRVARSGVTPAQIKEHQKIAQQICSAGKVGGVASLIKSDRAIAVSTEALDHDAWLLNTPAGIVDLRSGVLIPADPDQLCTKSTSVPPDYSGSTPTWTAFLAEATAGDAELGAFLQRLSGYCLTGSTREQQFTFIFGPGGNGKSIFLNTLSGILGSYATTASMETFTASHNERHSTEVAMLAGARVVTASETAAGKRWDEARLKSLTGGEAVTARFMRQDNFTYLPQFKLVFVGNHKPELRDIDPAMRRRIQLVPFMVTPKVIDKELASKLRGEWPAILAWMLQGCRDWLEQGLNPPPVVTDFTKEYFDDEDAVGRWMKQCVEQAEGVFVTSQELYLSWREWTNKNGEHTGSLKRLSSAMIVRLGRDARHQDKDTRKLGFKGIRLRETDGFEALN